ncbi:glycosyltransferase [Leuconostoc suionicum]|uniref:glycosyltransferase n=1 Tax=Leuconostoc suionicum TaxID=1511761 RepID=UPI00233E67A2|nr:glycosyltransferase [Leuconostoc suionicum]MDC2806445.1 glycosyltransferase [Leuconostoc suionicum]MDC2823957.1 glycosyltransferase [Leuconostoc suionicum]
MNILIHDIAVKRNSGGVFTILRQVYEAAKVDKKNNYIFVLGSELFTETNNIKIVVREDLQKNYIKRVLFDFGVGSKQLLEYNPDVVVSMQNTSIFGLRKTKQYVYLHQPLPFQNAFHFVPWVKNEQKLFFYQYVVGSIIKLSLKWNKNSKVIVQSQWLKTELLNRKIKKAEQIIVSYPKLSSSVRVNSQIQTDEKVITLFFPSTDMLYKNHRVVLNALDLIDKEHRNLVNVLFTLNKTEYSNLIGGTVPDQVKLLGRINHEKVLKILSRSTLIFPSQIESYGLPILEAKSLKRPVLVNNIPVLRETVGNYDDVYYFTGSSASDLANKIVQMLKQKNTISEYVSEDIDDSEVLEDLIKVITGNGYDKK